MTVELTTQLREAFAERAASTTLSTNPAFGGDDDPVFRPPPQRSRWLVSAVAAFVAAAIVGMIVWGGAGSDRSEMAIGGPRFDGDEIPTAPVTFVLLRPAVDVWSPDGNDDSTVSGFSLYCSALTAQGHCAEIVGGIRTTYRRVADEATLEVINELGPPNSRSNQWQSVQLGEPIEIRGHPGAAVTGAGDETGSTADTQTPTAIGWSENDHHRVLLTSPDGRFSTLDLVAIAETLIESAESPGVSYLEVASIDNDDNDPTAIGNRRTALVVGRDDGQTCVALIGVNGDGRCTRELIDDHATALRMNGSADNSLVAAVVPAATARVRVDLLDTPSVTLTPIPVEGFDDKFILQALGTTFPTRVTALDAAGGELMSTAVDPLLQDNSGVRGVIDGQAWALHTNDNSSEGSIPVGAAACLVLTDVNTNYQTCSEPAANGITQPTTTGRLQFGWAGTHVAAIDVNGQVFATVAIPDHDDRAWVVPVGARPVPLDATGEPLDESCSDDDSVVVPMVVGLPYSQAATAVWNGGLVAEASLEGADESHPVTTQQPTPGTTVTCGATVKLTVGPI